MVQCHLSHCCERIAAAINHTAAKLCRIAQAYFERTTRCSLSLSTTATHTDMELAHPPRLLAPHSSLHHGASDPVKTETVRDRGLTRREHESELHSHAYASTRSNPRTCSARSTAPLLVSTLYSTSVSPPYLCEASPPYFTAGQALCSCDYRTAGQALNPGASSSRTHSSNFPAPAGPALRQSLSLSLTIRAKLFRI